MAKSANIESIIKRVRDGLDETGREKIAEEVTKVIKNLPKTKTSSLVTKYYIC